MRVLVTGGSGFVGRHLTAELLSRGDTVDTVDLHPTLINSDSAHQHFITDVRDFFRHDPAHYDLVLHCAAVVGGRAKIDGAPLDLAVDLAIDADLFAWATRTRPGKIIYFSSSAAYPVMLQGRDSHVALREDHIDLGLIQNPDAVYGWAKLTGEILARHAQQAGLDILIVRPFSGYGTDQPLDYPFPSFIDRAVRRADPFDIWGDGQQIRDWIHIDDICAAVLAAVNQKVIGPVNLGTGIATTFDQLAAMACAAAGYAPTFRYLATAPTGVAHRVCDPTKMLAFYTPQVNLAAGIERALTRAQLSA